MGYISRMKYNMKRKRDEQQRIESLGRVVFHGKLKEMPKDMKKPGRRYKEFRNHGMFGHSNNIVIEMRRGSRKA